MMNDPCAHTRAWLYLLALVLILFALTYATAG